ncbi:MAG: xanthine dehydrogenase accessory protein XdhC [Rhodospirillaceae bacterium]
MSEQPSPHAPEGLLLTLMTQDRSPAGQGAESKPNADVQVLVTIIQADGSSPQTTGAALLVEDMASSVGFRGTIGGGALEHEALAIARSLQRDHSERNGVRLFSAPWRREVRDFPLGPSLGQCCGGRVKLLFEVFGPAERRELASLMRVPPNPATTLALRPLDSGTPIRLLADRKDPETDLPLPVQAALQSLLSGAKPRDPLLCEGWYAAPLGAPRPPLFLYGAGHVGRAVAKVFADLPFWLHWVDTAPERFPSPFPDHAVRILARDPALIARHAPDNAWHLVMTYSHAIDLAVCEAVLSRGQFSHLGVIASQTKKTRFLKRLREGGIAEAQLERLQAPLGLPDLPGKDPAVIAISIAADLLTRLHSAETETADEAPTIETQGDGGA